MANRPSRHLGLYYLVLKGGIGKGAGGDRDYPEFLDLLLRVLAGTGYRLYAFCLLPGQAHLAVRMSHVPLADFTQRLATKYDQWMQQKHGRPGDLQEAHEPRLFDREEPARELIRFIHLLPLKLARNPEGYPWSGQRTYLGKARTTCVDTRAGLQLFARHSHEARDAYSRYFQEGMRTVTSQQSAPPPSRVKMQDGSPTTAHIAQKCGAIESLDELVASIAELGNRHAEDVRSCSRERLCSLLRAVIMWHATRLELASASEVSQYLHRDPSSLYCAMKRYSVLYPGIFSRPGDFQELAKLSAGRINGWSVAVSSAAYQPRSLTDCAPPG